MTKERREGLDLLDQMENQEKMGQMEQRGTKVERDTEEHEASLVPQETKERRERASLAHVSVATQNLRV